MTGEGADPSDFGFGPWPGPTVVGGASRGPWPVQITMAAGRRRGQHEALRNGQLQEEASIARTAKPVLLSARMPLIRLMPLPLSGMDDE